MMLKTLATMILLFGALALFQGASWGLPIILVSLVIFQTAGEIGDKFNNLPKYNLAKLKGAWVQQPTTKSSPKRQKRRAAKPVHAH
ncbi:hypothetical protein H0A36_00045 [Endozoicomonas sp. SM1973]|uniref:Uncharacterized protein n=1 Tax=Spartinivicinus marinus TaxID=2994442 RepID=A0A853I590_9GAMM|nr:hypothetical protein [Spartinivicinus marinus]MCX4026538.1 hypothetical protein [Spartinivicinus marinus]NYZ64375.1 hypothetical protein [Spartinivicinus marinus]